MKIKKGKRNKLIIVLPTLELVLQKMQNAMKVYKKNTKISITIFGDGSEIFDYNLPAPHNYFRKTLDRYTIEYYLHGDFFCTNKSADYLNDILARFTLSMNVIEAKAFITRENLKQEALKLYQNNQFNGLKSIKKYKYKETVDVGNDNIFWAIKLYTEDLIKECDNNNGIVAYSLLESFAFTHFSDRAKDKSTLKAKCRFIWNWYDARNWTIPTRKRKLTNEELKMTRSENAKKVAAQKADKNYKKVANILSGLFNGEFKKKNGKWHIGKIAVAVNMTEKTVSKYIKEFEKERLFL